METAVLEISSKQLKTLDAVSGNFKRVDLSKNQFEKIPDWILTLPELRSLDFHSNRLKSIEFEGLFSKEVKEIQLQNNCLRNLNFDILSTVCRQLRLLNIGSNEIDCYFEDISLLCESIQYLLLSNNIVRGCLPEMRIFSKLVVINASHNSLEGFLPIDLFSSPVIEQIWLSHNFFTGSLPEIPKINKITHISLENNELSGPIPDSWRNATLLSQFWLDHNQINGSLPDFSNWSQLTCFGVGSNKLEGVIPASIRTCQKLRYFWANHNSFQQFSLTPFLELPFLWGFTLFDSKYATTSESMFAVSIHTGFETERETSAFIEFTKAFGELATGTVPKRINLTDHPPRKMMIKRLSDSINVMVKTASKSSVDD